MGWLDDFPGLGPAAGGAGGGQRRGPTPEEDVLGPDTLLGGDWSFADTGAGRAQAREPTGTPIRMIGGQTALPPAYTMPRLDTLPRTAAGIADFESARAREALITGWQQARAADLAMGAAGPSDTPGGGQVPPLSWWNANGSFPNTGAGLDPRLRLRPVDPLLFDGTGPFNPTWIPMPLEDTGDRLTFDDLEQAWDGLTQLPSEAWYLLDGSVRQFANNVPFIGPGLNNLEAWTYALLEAPDGQLRDYHAKELENQNRSDREFQETYPFVSRTAADAGSIFGAVALSELAAVGISLGIGGWAAPIIDKAATGGLAAGLDTFAREYLGAEGSIWDRVGAGLEHMPRDMFYGATLGPIVDRWTKDMLGDASDGIAGRVAGDTIEGLGDAATGLLGWLLGSTASEEAEN